MGYIFGCLYTVWFILCVIAVATDKINFGLFIFAVILLPPLLYLAVPVVNFLLRIDYHQITINPVFFCAVSFVGLVIFGVFATNVLVGIGHLLNNDIKQASEMLVHARKHGKPILNKEGYVIGYKVMIDNGDGVLKSAYLEEPYPEGKAVAHQPPARNNLAGLHYAHRPDSPVLDPYKMDAVQNKNPNVVYYLVKALFSGQTVFGRKASRSSEAQIIKTERIDPKNPLKTDMKPPKGQSALDDAQSRRNKWKSL